MKTAFSVLLVLTLALCAAATWAQQSKPVAGSTAAAANAARPAAAATSTTKPVRTKSLDGDATYKANCARCHAAPRKFSERRMATVMVHMRVRANLTEEETKAILKYLTR